jgi:hypothetical protein
MEHKRGFKVLARWDYSWTAIFSIEVQLVLRLTSLCQSYYYLRVSVCMYDMSGWIFNPYPARGPAVCDVSTADWPVCNQGCWRDC